MSLLRKVPFARFIILTFGRPSCTFASVCLMCNMELINPVEICLIWKEPRTSGSLRTSESLLGINNPGYLLLCKKPLQVDSINTKAYIMLMGLQLGQGLAENACPCDLS